MPKIPESVLVVIYSKTLEVLLIERSDRPSFWQSVTGSKDRADEPLRFTAIREVGEETGFAVGTCTLKNPAAQLAESALRNWALSSTYEIYPFWRHRYAHGVTHNIEHVFGLCLPKPTPPHLNPHEHRAYVWLPWQQAANKCFSPSNVAAILALDQYL